MARVKGDRAGYAIMQSLITAVRAYEANISVQESFLQMAERALRLAQ